MKRYILAITGASGGILGIRLLEELVKAKAVVYTIITKQSFSIIRDEVGLDWTNDTEKKIRQYLKTRDVSYLDEYNLAAPISSGSFKTDAMIVCPCSMKTLSGIASGYANNLVERAADVMLKEGRPLILVPRETPFNSIHLENMLRLSRLGVRIIPPIPGFYHKPRKIEDIIDFIVGKVLDSLSVEHSLFKRWG